MNDQHLDKLIKESYTDSASEYDHEAMWAAVEPHISDRSRSLILWWSLGLATLLGLTSAYMYISHSSSLDTPTIVAASSRPLEDTVADQKASLPVAQPERDNILTEEVEEKASATSTYQSEPEIANHLGLEASTMTSQIDNKREASKANFEDLAIQEVLSTIVQAENAYLTEEANLLAEEAYESSRDRVFSQMLPHTVPSLAYDRDVSTSIPSLMPPSVAKTLARSQSLEVFVGYDILDDQLRLTIPSSQEDLDTRSNQESALDRMTIGLQYIKPLHNRWEILVGAQYSQYTSRRSAMDRLIGTDTREVLIERIYSEQGVEEIYESQTVTTTTTRNSTSYLREHQLSLIVGTRYHVHVKDRFSVFGEAYVLPHLTSGRSGSISYGDNLYDTSLDNDQIYLTTLAFDAQIGIGLSYRLQDQLDVVTRLVASRRLTDNYSDNYGIQLRRSTVGIRLGILRRF